MNRPQVNEHGEVEPKSVELLSRDQLALWVKERLHREDWTIPGGAPGAEMPHYLFALLYPKLDRFTREDLQNIIVEFLQDLVTNSSSEWLDEPGHELIMLADPVLIQSPRREEAIDLLLNIADSERLKSGSWPSLHFRALQGLIVLRHRASIDFWQQQGLAQDTRYAPAILEGLAQVDVAAPFSWLSKIDWDDAVDDGIVGLLPSLLENYGSAKVVTSIEAALPALSHRGASTLLTFCAEEGLTISRSSKTEREDASDLAAPDPSPSMRHDVRSTSVAEQLLTKIWAEVLGVEKVGIHDNFFELGGDSILIIQIIGRANQAGLELNTRQLLEHQTIAELIGEVKPAAAFSPPKLPLRKRLRRERAAGRTDAIVPRLRANYFPASYSEQRLWFLNQLEPESPFYNISAALRLNGLLYLPALERCFHEIIRRHETLRTTFQEVEGRPMQVIAPTGSVSLQMLDLSDLSRVEREREVGRLGQEDAQRPFDLSSGPLLRLTLLRLSENEHVLLIVMHHIISDEWSIGVFIRELGALYQAFAAGAASPLRELSIQYADFSLWQREWLSGEALEGQLDYWRQQLAGASTVLELPSDRSRPHVQSFHGAEHHLTLSGELSESLKAFSQNEGVTLFMTLLAAFQTLLYRYTGQEDIIVGTPIVNRARAELEPIIGCLVDTIVLRSDLSGDPTVRELLARIRDVCLGAYAHQDIPFETIVEELQPERSPSHMPLFQVMLVLENEPLLAPELEGLSIVPMRIFGRSAQFDLTLIATNTNSGLRCVFEYNTDLFDHSTVVRLANQFHTLLSGIVTQPHSPLSSLPMFKADEEQQLLVDWNDTTAAAPSYVSIAQWFAEQTERTPAAIALEYEDQQVSYRELNERANQLAHRLLKIGVRAEMLVGVCLERSVDQMVAILGVLKAGAAYVPLDPSYPQERLNYILHDIRASVVLTAEYSLETFNNSNAQTICLDREWPPISDESIENPQTNANALAEHAAYVIYTSGSTGRPKGVLVTHRNLINSTAARTYYYREPVTRFLLLSSLAFDSSVAGIFWTLCSGGTLILAPKNYWQEPQLLAESIARHKVSHILTLPSLYRLILEKAERWQMNSLRTVILGGEVCALDVVSRHHALISETPLFNEYGPTEATVWSSVYACLKAKPASASVPIGRPISNTQIYLLDRRLNPVPIGVPGELHIGGRGLSRGYLHHPSVTAEKYIPHPFSAEPGARLYKTGDLAHFLPDGNIEFLGRLDHQLKIRGFRIELGEIEAILAQHESVREVVVIVREDVPGDRRLVAYVVGEKEVVPSIVKLRGYLAEKLPDFMIPSSFVALEELPLTPNGKLDRRALPAVNEARAQVIPPRTPVEEALAMIWAEVLRLEVKDISVNDNFFELGGHSLLATQVLSRIRKGIRVDLPLRAIFEDSTISGLAATIADLPRDDWEVKRRAELVSLLRELSEEEVDAMLDQGGANAN